VEKTRRTINGRMKRTKAPTIIKVRLSPCPHCKKTNRPKAKCWWRPDVKGRKCGIWDM